MGPSQQHHYQGYQERRKEKDRENGISDTIVKDTITDFFREL